jgi:formaldehyde-activating enzyme involved in methanogenesis
MAIIEAIMSAAAARDKNLGKRIEAAMAKAVKDTMELGISDPEVIKEAMLLARERVKTD